MRLGCQFFIVEGCYTYSKLPRQFNNNHPRIGFIGILFYLGNCISLVNIPPLWGKSNRFSSVLMIELPHLRNSVSRRWFHEGRQVYPSPGHRVVMSSGSVLLRNVTREEWGGEWRCRVENQLGSKDVTLNLVVFGKSIRIFISGAPLINK